MVMFWLLHWLKRRDCSYKKQKDVEGIMGQDMTKGTLWLCLSKNLDYVASAKYDYLRAFPENLKHNFQY